MFVCISSLNLSNFSFNFWTVLSPFSSSPMNWKFLKWSLLLRKLWRHFFEWFYSKKGHKIWNHRLVLASHLASTKWKLDCRAWIMLLSPEMRSSQTSYADFSEARAGVRSSLSKDLCNFTTELKTHRFQRVSKYGKINREVLPFSSTKSCHSQH